MTALSSNEQIHTIASAGLAGFPIECGSMVEAAVRSIKPFVDTNYKSQQILLFVSGQQVKILDRIHFQFQWPDELSLSVIEKSSLQIQCLLTRSTSGYVRQIALTKIIVRNEPWVVPYVMLLAGEYVVEIAEIMFASVNGLDRDVYANFIRENRTTMSRLKSRAISYWNCYFRRRFPDRNSYPSLCFLNEVEKWAD
jgi:hypothetical protein